MLLEFTTNKIEYKRKKKKETGTHTLKVPETVSLADLTADSRSNPGRSELLLVLSSDSLEAAYEFQSANKEGEDDVVAAVPVVCWSAENHFCIVKILLCNKIPHDYLGDNKNLYICLYQNLRKQRNGSTLVVQADNFGLKQNRRFVSTFHWEFSFPSEKSTDKNVFTFFSLWPLNSFSFQFYPTWI